MQYRYISAFITLVAGLMTCVISMVGSVGLMESLKTLLLVLVVFYIIGTVAKNIIYGTLKESVKVDEVDDDLQMGDGEHSHNAVQ